MQQNTSQQKRRYPRRQFSKPVAFICKGVSAVAEGMEIGEGGVSLQTDFVLNIEDKILVNFYLPQAGFFSVRAIVRNTVPGEITKKDHMVYGLGFVEVSLSLKRKIRAYVARTSHAQEDLLRTLGMI